MNAYELALQLQVESSQAEYGYVVDDWKLLDDSATMLRQQAEKIRNMEIWEKKYLDRIAELELQLFKVTNRTIATRKKLTKLKKEKIRAYDNGYEDGQKSYTQSSTQLHPESKK
jgi:hypothetical protein